MLLVWYKFRHIEHNNTTLCIHFSNLSPVRVWHLMTQQNDAVSNLYSINCSGAPSVVWNPHSILVHPVKLCQNELHFTFHALFPLQSFIHYHHQTFRLHHGKIHNRTTRRNCKNSPSLFLFVKNNFIFTWTFQTFWPYLKVKTWRFCETKHVTNNRFSTR